MKKFTTVKSIVIPLALNNVDTDMIIPATFLTSVSREGYGENVFRRHRDENPDFAFNQERYNRAEVLAVGANFGCGSSREHAVWALHGWGLKAIIGESFADIFSSNCGKNGLILVTLPRELVRQILSESEKGEYLVQIDLESQTVILPGDEVHHFDYDQFRKHCILSGLDDIDYIRSHDEHVSRFRQRQTSTTFFSSLTPNNQ